MFLGERIADAAPDGALVFHERVEAVVRRLFFEQPVHGGLEYMRRLKDRTGPGLRVLFVGINPGIRSAQMGHHFAGYSNRFWKLLYESQLVPEPIGTEDDHRLPEWGFGITNLVPRATPGIDTLAPAEYCLLYTSPSPRDRG